jgi:hypothetical protein
MSWVGVFPEGEEIFAGGEGADARGIGIHSPPLSFKSSRIATHWREPGPDAATLASPKSRILA